MNFEIEVVTGERSAAKVPTLHHALAMDGVVALRMRLPSGESLILTRNSTDGNFVLNSEAQRRGIAKYYAFQA